jgi:hypothetical protein
MIMPVIVTMVVGHATLSDAREHPRAVELQGDDLRCCDAPI